MECIGGIPGEVTWYSNPRFIDLGGGNSITVQVTGTGRAYYIAATVTGYSEAGSWILNGICPTSIGCLPTGTYTLGEVSTPDGWPSTITATVTAAGPGTAESAGCDAWISAFDLQQLSQAEVDLLSANWPTTYPLQNPPVPNPAGCYYGLFSGMPCGATSMVLQILSDRTCTLTIGWSDGVYVSIHLDHSGAAGIIPGDCCANFSLSNEGTATITVSATGSPPCDFNDLETGSAADMILTANCVTA